VEDDNEEDEDLVRAAAEDYVALKGGAALGYLLEKVEEAVGRGDRLSAKAWSDIADEVERIIGERGIRNEKPK
jgi:hypothetical protein